jgi:hypothetical protein
MKKSGNIILIKFFCLSAAVAVLLAGCGKSCEKTGVEKEEEETKSFALIPADSNVVLGLSWEKLSQSPIGDKMKAGIPPEVVPLLQDVEAVTFGFSIKGMGQEPEDFVGVISGKLDETAILAQMNEQATKQGTTLSNEEYEGVKIYTSPQDPKVGIVFLEGKVVIGSKMGVKKAIDLSKHKGDSIEKNKDIMAMISGMDTQKMLWAVGIVPEGALPGQGAPPEAGNPMGAFSAVKSVDLAVDYYKDLTVDLGIMAGAEEEAKQMMTMANSYKTLFGSSLAQQNPSLGKVFNNVMIDVKGSRLAISLKLDEATVKELSEQAKPNPVPMDEGTALPTPPSEG